jgi:hypothetical protein
VTVVRRPLQSMVCSGRLTIRAVRYNQHLTVAVQSITSVRLTIILIDGCMVAEANKHSTLEYHEASAAETEGLGSVPGGCSGVRPRIA